MASVIDQLPESQRKKVIDALLAGEALRDVAKIAGISHTAVDNYKRKVFMPTLQAAQKLNAAQQVVQTAQEQVISTATLTRATLAADPYLTRIAEHQRTIDAAIGFACDREDPKSVAALIGTDFKGLELQARLTGRLESAPQTQVNITFMSVPGSGSAAGIGVGSIINITPVEDDGPEDADSIG